MIQPVIISNLFPFHVEQICERCHLCVLQENSNSVGVTPTKASNIFIEIVELSVSSKTQLK